MWQSYGAVPVGDQTSGELAGRDSNTPARAKREKGNRAGRKPKTERGERKLTISHGVKKKA
jgi:hypothetical protein